MTNWHARIKYTFKPSCSRLTLISMPHSLSARFQRLKVQYQIYEHSFTEQTIEGSKVFAKIGIILPTALVFTIQSTVVCYSEHNSQHSCKNDIAPWTSCVQKVSFLLSNCSRGSTDMVVEHLPGSVFLSVCYSCQSWIDPRLSAAEASSNLLFHTIRFIIQYLVTRYDSPQLQEHICGSWSTTIREPFQLADIDSETLLQYCFHVASIVTNESTASGWSDRSSRLLSILNPINSWQVKVSSAASRLFYELLSI